MARELIVLRPEGLYCPAGDFFIDPWRPVERAVITHAHADHARRGHGRYLAAASARHVLRLRLGEIALETLAYGERRRIGEVTLSLHPAGHVLGSAQVRLEHRGEVWVVSGDYKLVADPTCAAFEPVRCHTFVTESTFGLPVYRWPPEHTVFAEINAWWAANAARGVASVIGCYAFGKAQRILAGVDASIGPIVVHGAVAAMNRAYAATGVPLPPTVTPQALDRAALARSLVLAPPAATAATWMRRFDTRSGTAQTAFASGWMRLRGARRRGGYDRGFVLSDHADWPGLLSAIAATGCERVIITHGYEAPLRRYLEERGLASARFETPFGGEGEGAEEEVEANEAGDAGFA
ncbi:MAG: ligase-associated DNA damage response exonuclease [Casimicrobiaceae bacterium]|nr:ligase-associated DNA damage response exonuclease [Casimicrobiaceae bacterium]MCX8099448.1 ligase-associated DNA damage response exonuclease [Casimicrobiaceae bacterium]MDW8313115.1 ligase-associated DNA damage response exonuclease [Burkholderiales bacterium]